MVKPYNIVIDTNIIVSALKSRKGCSFSLLSKIDDKRFRVFLSVPLLLEYEAAIKRERTKIKLSKSAIDVILDYICYIAVKRKIYYLWRPFLKDPNDDMLLELAVESNCDFIITFNKKDFQGIDIFDIETLTPKDFLRMIGE